jgi:hypothetical protein
VSIRTYALQLTECKRCHQSCSAAMDCVLTPTNPQTTSESTLTRTRTYR